MLCLHCHVAHPVNMLCLPVLGCLISAQVPNLCIPTEPFAGSVFLLVQPRHLLPNTVIPTPRLWRRLQRVQIGRTRRLGRSWTTASPILCVKRLAFLIRALIVSSLVIGCHHQCTGSQPVQTGCPLLDTLSEIHNGARLQGVSYALVVYFVGSRSSGPRAASLLELRSALFFTRRRQIRSVFSIHLSVSLLVVLRCCCNLHSGRPCLTTLAGVALSRCGGIVEGTLSWFMRGVPFLFLILLLLPLCS